ncbi:MAG TPA: hypothetical protein P5248_11665, partial [Bacteroidales bacterium]|nr:hypothetical protein [Bacteroidales bacterium]
MRTLLTLALAILWGGLGAQDTCTGPDNGAGSTSLYPLGCGWVTETPMMIIDGLPPGTTIMVQGKLTILGCPASLCNLTHPPTVCEVFGGGGGGGSIICFFGQWELTLTGTGSLAGYQRVLGLPVQGVIHAAARDPGIPLQSFPGWISNLSGAIQGDPDFGLLELRAGGDFGLPSPGSNVLAQRPDGNWNVESFFDITYRIDFQGNPGGALSGYAGSSLGNAGIRMGVPPP